MKSESDSCLGLPYLAFDIGRFRERLVAMEELPCFGFDELAIDFVGPIATLAENGAVHAEHLRRRCESHNPTH